MTTKKPTAKQLAARKLFAQRAKAGTLGGKRKANPAKKAAPKKTAPKRKTNPSPPMGAKTAERWRVLPEPKAMKYWPTDFGGFAYKNKEDAIAAAEKMANFHGYAFSVDKFVGWGRLA